ncbi:MAG TPA: 23S rRNA (pseudouridine(1915)-N(3))-methyltransferase RlmH [Oscillospiraceae bacterium]|nr:23S rRNA (pseudouridine(1915)-N(3))-methyltransferase RlmH [Oscillospiraceae bacterium]HPK34503.1 23S rRNA (pseudouridine(1915)-N(3))-methyltransferase RlmH [Oscillospiraceae bacterium]HPR74731.1 23S rRNA (pseudouridine(1915)-N(3))-methyltransferase RlmH [Oscillospiraceae bacterium]
MNIKVICVGGLKEPFLRDAQKEYQKRLSASCSLEIVELGAKNDLPADRQLIEEGKKILEKAKNGYNIVLCIEGKEMTSEAFAQKVAELSANGINALNFMIGSSYGLSDEVKAAADLKLSFSQMTFPHQLFRIMLLEQLYRAFDILGARKYDK